MKKERLAKTLIKLKKALMSQYRLRDSLKV